MGDSDFDDYEAFLAGRDSSNESAESVHDEPLLSGGNEPAQPQVAAIAPLEAVRFERFQAAVSHIRDTISRELVLPVHSDALVVDGEPKPMSVPVQSILVLPQFEKGEGNPTLTHLHIDDCDHIRTSALAKMSVQLELAADTDLASGPHAEKTQLQYYLERHGPLAPAITLAIGTAYPGCSVRTSPELEMCIVDCSTQRPILAEMYERLISDGKLESVPSLLDTFARSPGVRGAIRMLVAAEAASSSSTSGQAGAEKVATGTTYDRCTRNMTGKILPDLSVPLVDRCLQLLTVATQHQQLRAALDDIAGELLSTVPCSRHAASSAGSTSASGEVFASDDSSGAGGGCGQGDAWADTRTSASIGGPSNRKQPLLKDSAYHNVKGWDVAARQQRHITLAAYSVRPYSSQETKWYNSMRNAILRHVIDKKRYRDAASRHYSSLYYAALLLICSPVREALLCAHSQLSGTTSSRSGSVSSAPSPALADMLLGLADLPPLVWLLLSADVWTPSTVPGGLGSSGEQHLSTASLAGLLADPTCRAFNVLWYMAYHFYSRAVYYDKIPDGSPSEAPWAVTSSSKGSEALRTPDLQVAFGRSKKEKRAYQQDPEFFPRILAVRTARRLVDSMHLNALEHADPQGLLWCLLLLQTHTDGWLPCRMEDPSHSPHAPQNRMCFRPNGESGLHMYWFWPGGWRLSTNTHGFDPEQQWIVRPVEDAPAKIVYTVDDQAKASPGDGLYVIISAFPGDTMWEKLGMPVACQNGPIPHWLYAVPHRYYAQFRSLSPHAEGVRSKSEDTEGVVQDSGDDVEKGDDNGAGSSNSGNASRAEQLEAVGMRVSVPKDESGKLEAVIKELQRDLSKDEVVDFLGVFDLWAVDAPAIVHENTQCASASSWMQASYRAAWGAARFAWKLYDEQLAAGITPRGLVVADKSLLARHSHSSDAPSSSFLASPARDVMNDRALASLYPSEVAEADGRAKGAPEPMDVIDYPTLPKVSQALSSADSRKRASGSAAGSAVGGTQYIIRPGDCIIHRPNDTSFNYPLLVLEVNVQRSSSSSASSSVPQLMRVSLVCLRDGCPPSIETLSGSSLIRYEGMDIAQPLCIDGYLNSQVWAVDPSGGPKAAEMQALLANMERSLNQLAELRLRLFALQWAWMGALRTSHNLPRPPFTIVNMSTSWLVQAVVERALLTLLVEATAPTSSGRGKRKGKVESTLSTETQASLPAMTARHAWLCSVGTPPSTEAYRRHGWPGVAPGSKAEDDLVALLQGKVEATAASGAGPGTVNDVDHSDGDIEEFRASSTPAPSAFSLQYLRQTVIKEGLSDVLPFTPVDCMTGLEATEEQIQLARVIAAGATKREAESRHSGSSAATPATPARFSAASASSALSVTPSTSRGGGRRGRGTAAAADKMLSPSSVVLVNSFGSSTPASPVRPPAAAPVAVSSGRKGGTRGREEPQSKEDAMSDATVPDGTQQQAAVPNSRKRGRGSSAARSMDDAAGTGGASEEGPSSAGRGGAGSGKKRNVAEGARQAKQSPSVARASQGSDIEVVEEESNIRSRPRRSADATKPPSARGLYPMFKTTKK